MSIRERLRTAGMAGAVATLSLTCVVACRTSATTVDAPTVAKEGPTPRTPWGKPDLQGIWSREVDIPLERPAKYANQEFFTDAQRAELDRQIAGIINRDSTETGGRGAPSETSIPNSPRHPSPCIFPSAGGLH